MNISGLKVESGPWRGLGLEGLKPGLTVVFGPNESGKSTLPWLVRSILFGYVDPPRQRFLPLRGPFVATLELSTLYGPVRVQRRRDRFGEHAIVEPQWHVAHPVTLESLLGPADAKLFDNVFSLDLLELQGLRMLHEDEAAAQLYNLTAGLERVSLVDLLQELADSRNGLLALRLGEHADDRSAESDEASSGPVAVSKVEQLLLKRESLAAQIENLSSLGIQFAQRTQERRQLQAEVQQLQQDVASLENDVWTLETALSLRDKWQQKAHLELQLAALGEVAPVPDGAVRRLEFYDARIKKHRHRLQRLKGLWKQARANLKAIPVNELLWRHAPQVAAMADQRELIAGLERRVGQLKQAIDATSQLWSAEIAQLGLKRDASPEALEKLSSDAVMKLQPLAQSFLQARRQWKQAVAESRTAEEIQKQQAEQAAQAAAKVGGGLDGALEQARQLVNDLRARLQFDERLEKLQTETKALKEEADEALEGAQLTTPWLVGLGVGFAGGATLLLAGLFLGWGWLAAAAGVLLMAGAAAAKWMLEQQQWQRYDESLAARATLRKQLVALQEERAFLDRRLPQGGGPLTMRLKDAEAALARLQGMAGVEVTKQVAAQTASSLREHREAVRQKLHDVTKQWRKELARLGLPDSFSPADARRFGRKCKKARSLSFRLAQQRQELAEAQQSYENYEQRLNKLFADLGLTPAPGAATEKLLQLRDELNGVELNMRRRADLAARFGRLRKRRRRLQSRIRHLGRRRLALFQRVGAFDRADFLRRVEQFGHYAKLRDELAAANREIAAALSDRLTEAGVRRLLEDTPLAEIQRRRDELLLKHQNQEESLRRRMERRAQLDREIQQLANDRQLPEKQLELGLVEQQLRAALEQWRILATTGFLLDTIRELYETQRQPQLVQAASAYFTRLCGGKYTRLWVPLGQRTLRLDLASGGSLTVDQLSEGTREQLYLCLRLALVDRMAAQGIHLPLLLDEPLVNFDKQRMRAAAELLREFADQGRQVLVFTCHEHQARLFQRLGCDVRALGAQWDWTVVDGQEAEPIRALPAVAARETLPPVPQPEPVVRTTQFPPPVPPELPPPVPPQLPVPVEVPLLPQEVTLPPYATGAGDFTTVEFPVITLPHEEPAGETSAAPRTMERTGSRPAEPPSTEPATVRRTLAWPTFSAFDAEEFPGELRDKAFVSVHVPGQSDAPMTIAMAAPQERQTPNSEPPGRFEAA